MTHHRCFLLAATALCIHHVSLAAGTPADELATFIQTFYGKAFTTDWKAVESLPGSQWAPLPPTSLQNCLPDGGCFARQGRVVIAGRTIALMATGARTIVSNVYLRNPGQPFGSEPLLASLKSLNLTTELARCPVEGSTGGTNWYKVKGGATSSPGVLSIQTSCAGRPCEGLVLTQGDALPGLQPNQVKLYSEQCSVPAASRQAVSNAPPHEALAKAIAALIPKTTGPALSDWKSLSANPDPITWAAAPPQKMDLTFKNDPNPMGKSASVKIASREFSVLASGTATQPKVIYLDESGLHPRGEHMLGALYSQGFTVQLARCGPVYTESTNNWYTVKSANTHPVMLRQSIRYEGQRVQDAYELRLDNTLPKRDPRDRDPGVAGCR